MPDVMVMQGATTFFLPKSKEKAALAALKASKDRASFVAVTKTLVASLAALGWLVHRDDDGNIDGLLMNDDYAWLVEKDLAILAPYVKRGSSMVFGYVSGHPEPHRLASFDGKTVKFRTLTKREMNNAELFEAPGFDPEDADAAPALAWPKSGKVPRERTPYTASSTFGRGEWLEHSKFGAGLVTELLDGPRVRVSFSDAERVLIHGRT